MANQQTLQGDWNVIKGKLRSRWGQLTDNDLAEGRGEFEQLVGTIQRKTGEGREAIERYLRELSSEASATMGAVTEKAQQYASQAGQYASQYASQAGEALQQAGEQAAEQISEGYRQAERVVRDQPAISVAVCFGVGVLTGLLVAALLRMR
jgi:uncharacterized protein YjbJ (UPF0337 family)